MSTRKSKLHKYALVLLITIIGVAAYLLLRPSSTTAPGHEPAAQQTAGQPVEPAETKPKYIDLQPTVDKWLERQTGQAGVVVYDLNNDRAAAQVKIDRSYFAASLYKLFVAYEGYKEVQAGRYNLEEPYLGEYRRGDCLDLMLRESHSPCAETMWNELGKAELTDRLKAYGINNTTMTSITTTAEDVSLLLRRLFEKQDLNKEFTALYMGSLKDQPAVYRRGLPQSFKTATVYNKVGWNLEKEWHDAAIVSFPGGRNYVVVVLTENVGIGAVTELGKAIEAAVLDAD